MRDPMTGSATMPIAFYELMTCTFFWLWQIVGIKKPTSAPKPYPGDASDEEWSFLFPCLILCRLDGAQREHDLRAVFKALRWLVRTGACWRRMSHDFLPWTAVFQPIQRWLKSG